MLSWRPSSPFHRWWAAWRSRLGSASSGAGATISGVRIAAASCVACRRVGSGATRAGGNSQQGCACGERAPPSLVIAPSRRTLLLLGVGAFAVLVVGAAAWFWYAAEQSRVMAPYPAALVRVPPAHGPEATPRGRAAPPRALEAIPSRAP